jgi:F-type H+-transporting ATPase subunit b
LIAAFTQFGAEEASGLGALGVDPKAFVIQLITFLLAFLVLKRYAFKPILKVMDERRRTIEDGVKLGEDMKIERAKLEKTIASELSKARSEADSIIANSHDTARQVAADVEAKAQKKADGLVSEAKSRISQEEARSRQKLKGELVGLISDATEAIIDEKVDAKKDAQLIDTALKGRA